MTLAFYDLETTGLSPAFDQPLQFAAILTDDEFKEIERVNLRCRIAPHRYRQVIASKPQWG
jgi:exodeoxyribonuclease-1